MQTNERHKAIQLKLQALESLNDNCFYYDDLFTFTKIAFLHSIFEFSHTTQLTAQSPRDWSYKFRKYSLTIGTLMTNQ